MGKTHIKIIVSCRKMNVIFKVDRFSVAKKKRKRRLIFERWKCVWLLVKCYSELNILKKYEEKTNGTP